MIYHIIFIADKNNTFKTKSNKKVRVTVISAPVLLVLFTAQ